MVDIDWRPPTHDDRAEWATLLAAIEAVDKRFEVYGPEDLDDEWDSVWSDPEHNAIFGWLGSELVAFGWLRVMVGGHNQHKIECWGGVRPDHRRRGIGTELLTWQLERARKIVPTLDAALPTRIDMDGLAGHHGAIALAERFGFEKRRVFLDLERPLADELPDVQLPDGVELRPWDPALDEAVRLAHNEAFADHWSSEPRTPEMWAQWVTGHRGFRTDLSFVCLADDDIVAYLLAATYPADWEGTGQREGWVQTLGVRRPWRGQGLARALLARSIEAMRAAPDELEVAILGVDYKNPTGAVRLYEGMGFRPARELWLYSASTPERLLVATGDVVDPPCRRRAHEGLQVEVVPPAVHLSCRAPPARTRTAAAPTRPAPTSTSRRAR